MGNEESDAVRYNLKECGHQRRGYCCFDHDYRTVDRYGPERWRCPTCRKSDEACCMDPVQDDG